MSGSILIATEVFVLPHVKYWLLQSGSELCLVQSLFHTAVRFWACAWTCENGSENNSQIFSDCHAEFGTLILKRIIVLGSCKGTQDLLEHENWPTQGSQSFASLCFTLKCMHYVILFCKLLWSILHLFTFSTAKSISLSTLLDPVLWTIFQGSKMICIVKLLLWLSYWMDWSWRLLKYTILFLLTLIQLSFWAKHRLKLMVC
jgi:hypothetical protein